MDWILGHLALLGNDVEGQPPIQQVSAMSKKNKSLSNTNSANTGSSSDSTPVASPVKLDTTSYLTMCFKDDCARECASDAAASMAADDSQWQAAIDDDGGTPQHYRGAARRKRTGQDASGKPQQHPKLKAAKPIKPVPPQIISLYQPSRTWPDGTLQILWQKKQQSAFGIKGIDLFQAYLELTLDDLSTIEISSEIASRYSNGTVEVHPDETTIQRIGSITCYLIRPMALQLPKEHHKDCPPQLEELLKHIPHNSMFQSWRKNEVSNQATEDFEDSIHDLHWKHHWHPTATILSYLWIQDITVDSRYRGVGLGLCLVEDACKRVAEGLSWILAAPPSNTSLEEYFCLMGFAPLFLEEEDDDKNKDDAKAPTTLPTFLARWNASPLNPNLDEVLPCVPHTAQQSKDQGFQL
ncbi:hypothetical protein ACA910_000463 [Epithemia clementina (nom. ined.)]